MLPPPARSAPSPDPAAPGSSVGGGPEDSTVTWSLPRPAAMSVVVGWPAARPATNPAVGPTNSANTAAAEAARRRRRSLWAMRSVSAGRLGCSCSELACRARAVRIRSSESLMA